MIDDAIVQDDVLLVVSFIFHGFWFLLFNTRVVGGFSVGLVALALNYGCGGVVAYCTASIVWLTKCITSAWRIATDIANALLHCSRVSWLPVYAKYTSESRSNTGRT